MKEYLIFGQIGVDDATRVFMEERGWSVVQVNESGTCAVDDPAGQRFLMPWSRPSVIPSLSVWFV